MGRTRVAGGGEGSPSGHRAGGVQIYVSLNYKSTDSWDFPSAAVVNNHDKGFFYLWVFAKWTYPGAFSSPFLNL